MKTIIIFIFLSLLAAFVYYILNVNVNSNLKSIGKENIENSLKVKIGMSESEVIQIMGEPELILPIDCPNNISHACLNYFYSTGNDSYPNGEFYIDSNKRVIKIYFPIRRND